MRERRQAGHGRNRLRPCEPLRGARASYLGSGAWLLAALLFGRIDLPAQSAPVRQPIDSGTVIRFHAPSGIITGRLTAPLSPGDSLARYCVYRGPPCDMGGRPVGLRTIALDSILRLEVARGSRWRHGGIIGGAVGAAVGGGFGSFAAGMCEGSDCPGQTSGIVLGGLFGAVFFGSIGALLGSAFPRW